MTCIPTLSDLGKYANFLLEEGFRNPDEFAKKMKADLGDSPYSEGDIQKAYNEARLYRSEQSAGNKGAFVRSPSDLTVEQFAKSPLGRKGTFEFINNLQAPDGSNPIWDKIAAREDLTPEEEEKAVKAHADATKSVSTGRAKSTNATTFLSDLQKKSASLRKEESPKSGPSAAQRFDTSIAATVGRDGLKSFKGTHGEIYKKLLNGDQLSTDETTAATKYFSENLVNRPLRVSKGGPLADIRAGARELAAPGKSRIQAAMDYLNRKYGPEAANAIRSRLSDGGDDTILNKVTGQNPELLTEAERGKVIKVLSEEATYRPPSDEEISESKTQLNESRKAARQSLKQAISESRTAEDWLNEWADKHISDPDQRDAFNEQLKEIDPKSPNIAREMADLKSQYTPLTPYEKFVAYRRATLLWGLKTLVQKVAGGHAVLNASEDFAQPVTAMTDMFLSRLSGKDRTVGNMDTAHLQDAARYASTKGFQDAKYLASNGADALATKRAMEGDKSLLAAISHDTIEGITHEPWAKTKFGRLYLRTPGRAHGGVYLFNQAYAISRAVVEQANVIALKEAADMRSRGETVPKGYVKDRTQYWFDNAKDSMVFNAIEGTEEAKLQSIQQAALEEAKGRTLTNDNVLTTSINRARSAMTKGQEAAFNSEFPFMKIPVNGVARAIEYAIGTPVRGVELAKRTIIDGELPKNVKAAVQKSRETNGGYRGNVQEAFRKSLGTALDNGFQRAMSKSVGRNSIGASYMMLGAAIYASGNLTPSYDVEKSDHPESIKFNGQWVPIGHFPLVGPLLVLSADALAEAHHKADGGALGFGKGIAGLLQDIPLLNPMVNPITAATDDGYRSKEPGLQRMGNDSITSNIPFGPSMHDLGTTIDQGRKVETYDPNSAPNTLGNEVLEKTPARVFLPNKSSESRPKSPFGKF